MEKKLMCVINTGRLEGYTGYAAIHGRVSWL